MYLPDCCRWVFLLPWLVSVGMASPVAITNPDMEAAPTAQTDGSIVSTIATGWTSSGGSSYTFNTNVGERYYNAPAFVDTGATGGASGTMAGPNFTGVYAAGSSRTIQQTLSATLAANMVYTLKGSLGHRTVDSGAAATPSQVTVELLSGGEVIASATVDPGKGIWNGTDVWADATASGTSSAAPAQLGQPLVIRFTKAAAGDYMDLDNVRLDATPVNDLSAGMIGYFPFDSDFSNRRGLVDGTPVAGALAGQAGGISGNAMRLRSAGGTANEHLNVAIGYGAVTGSDVNLGRNFTISAWYKLDQPPAGSGSGRYFVYEGDASGGDGYEVSYGIRDLSLGTTGVNDGQVFTEGSSSGNVLNIADAAVAGWHHILQTYASDGTTTTITTYIDGVNAGTLSPATAALVDAGLNIGSARNGVTDRGFDGWIDEVGLWNRVLGADEIQTVRSHGLSGTALVQPPVIASFTSSAAVVAGGGQATLSWNVSGASQVSISPGPGTVSASGTALVTPGNSTTYVLTATGPGGMTDQSRVSIQVDRGVVHVFRRGGQSNMQGVGQKSKLPALGLQTIPEVMLYHSSGVTSSGGAGHLIPVQACGFDSNTFGPEIGFADAMRDLCRGDSICLIKHAVGGTSLQVKWKPGANNADTANFGPEYKTFVSTVQAGLAALRAESYQPVIDGMLWQQGEQDSKAGLNTGGDGNATSAADYGTNLRSFVARVRSQFAADIGPGGLRFVLGQVLPYAPPGGEVQSANPGRDVVRQAELDADENSGAALSISNTATVPTDSVNYPTHMQEVDGYRDTDEVHLNWTAQLLLGRSMAYRMLRLSPVNYAAWAAARGVTGGPGNDDDHDGLTNFQEFAFGSHPENASQTAAPTTAVQAIGGVSYLTLTHRRDLNALGVTYRASISTDLQTWQDTAVFVDSVRQPDGMAVVRYRLPWTAQDATHSKGFLRITVQ
ncbi:MAG: sialate O-acetylesterase [Luteolibacter sp.]